MYYSVPKEVESYLTYLRGNERKSEATIRSYNHDLHLLFDFCKIPVTEWTEDSISNWIASMKDVSDTTIARRVSTIKSFFEWATRKKIVASNVAQYLDKPKVNRKLPEYLTMDEALKLKSVVTKNEGARDILIITLFLNCGLRISELTNLQVSNLEGDILKVVGKGNKTRACYLNESCITALKSYIQERKKNNATHNNLILSENFKNGISVSNVRKILQKYFKKAKINKAKSHAHALRHTFGVLQSEQGTPIRVLQELFGHANINTTTIYTQVTDKAKREAVTRFNI